MEDGGNRAPDYEYDEAHAVFGAGDTSPGRVPAQPEPGVPATADTNGDLGYDLAHDVPPA